MMALVKFTKPAAKKTVTYNPTKGIVRFTGGKNTVRYEPPEPQPYRPPNLPLGLDGKAVQSPSQPYRPPNMPLGQVNENDPVAAFWRNFGNIFSENSRLVSQPVIGLPGGMKPNIMSNRVAQSLRQPALNYPGININGSYYDPYALVPKNQAANSMMYSFPGMPRFPAGVPSYPEPSVPSSWRERVWEQMKSKYGSPKLIPAQFYKEFYGAVPTIVKSQQGGGAAGEEDDGYGYGYGGWSYGGGGGSVSTYSPNDWLTRLVNWKI